MNKTNKKLTNEDLAYIAGFLDGDGCILTQIVKNKQYKFGFTVRASICFYQKKARHWFMIWLKDQFDVGYISIRNDDMCVFTITGFTLVKATLLKLIPFLRIKRPVAMICLKVIELYQHVVTKADFLEVCTLIDKAANHNDSRNRKYTLAVIEQHLNSPVETDGFMPEIVKKSS